jgi:hypothetical protein
MRKHRPKARLRRQPGHRFDDLEDEVMEFVGGFAEEAGDLAKTASK